MQIEIESKEVTDDGAWDMGEDVIMADAGKVDLGYFIVHRYE